MLQDQPRENASSAPTGGLRRPRVVIVGAGMSGMLMGIRLKQAGIHDFCIYEKGDEVGGTWRENTYPGLSCDVPAHYYTYSFEPNPDWRHRFARGPEIHEYLRSVADKYGLRRHIRFNSELIHARHDGRRWQVRATDGSQDSADIVVSACGALHHPKYPDIEGLDDFAGAAFHSARWDHDVDLRGKRVGLIGTGSTGIQLATELSNRGHDLTIFQRTAQWVFPMPDRTYSRLQRWLTRRVPGLARAIYRYYEFAFEQFFAKAVVNRGGWRHRLIGRLVEWNLNRVKDRELRRKLTPPDDPMCKRMVLSWGFYPAMQRDNVKVVDQSIRRVRPEGIETADGRVHELDVLVMATGFKAHDYMQPLELETADGRKLSEVWADGAVAYRSVAVPGFPNFFMVFGPKSPIGNYSIISIAETQTRYIMDCIRLWQEGRYEVMAPSSEITRQLDRELAQSMDGTVWVSGCNSWYLDENGVPDTWPSTPARFREYLRRPKLEEFELHG